MTTYTIRHKETGTLWPATFNSKSAALIMLEDVDQKTGAWELVKL